MKALFRMIFSHKERKERKGGSMEVGMNDPTIQRSNGPTVKRSNGQTTQPPNCKTTKPISATKNAKRGAWRSE